MKKVLIVGAGRRAKATIIPAFWCLKDHFDITAIHTRTKRNVSLFNGQFNKDTIQNLDDVDFRSIDLIVIAIPVDQVRFLLKNLSKRSVKNIILILDTPVFNLKDIGGLKYTRLFKKVLVAEDFISIPSVVLIKDIIQSGKIGNLKHIHLFHSGFKYHALAMIKAISNNKRLNYIRTRKFFGEVRLKSIGMSNGVSVTMVEPRDYSIQKNYIVGSKGLIADYPINIPNSNIINYKIESGRYKSIILNSKELPQNSLDKSYNDHIKDCLEEVSLINDLKIRGYMEIVMSLDSKVSPYHYLPIDAVYDSLAIKISDKIGFFFDLGWNRFSLFRFCIRLFSLIMPA